MRKLLSLLIFIISISLLSSYAFRHYGVTKEYGVPFYRGLLKPGLVVYEGRRYKSSSASGASATDIESEWGTLKKIAKIYGEGGGDLYVGSKECSTSCTGHTVVFVRQKDETFQIYGLLGGL